MLLALTGAEAIRQDRPAVFAHLIAASVGILGVAWLLILTFYGFRYAPAPAGLELSAALAPYLASIPRPVDGAKLAVLTRFHLSSDVSLGSRQHETHRSVVHGLFSGSRLSPRTLAMHPCCIPN